jgi:hypothetical protein
LAVRLQLKLGAVAEQDRLPDSPDAIVVVEPSVGSVARSKGNLYVLVTSRITGSKARDAARLTAETIRNEYYYDESAGIRGCLIKTITLANKRLGHQRDRYGLGNQADGSGPIGIGVAVVRGNELYVATVGPTEAYLIRQARLSTLPDPHRDRGLPWPQLEPDVWRGELTFGDSLCLVSANMVARLGTDELKDALVTLHPQSAIEHLHARFVAADGRGSDGAIALEATEVGATTKQRTLVPVRPAEPLAGAPDRSPIPLADPVADGVAAIGAGANRAKDAAGGAMARGIRRVFDFLPRRQTAYRRVRTLSDRREVQRRAAVAVLAFVTVVGGLVAGVWAFGGPRNPAEAARSIDVGQAALADARDALARVSGPGIDLITDNPSTALDLLSKAVKRLDDARAAGVPASTTDPLRATAVAGLDKLFKVVPVATRPLYKFGKSSTPHDLAVLVRGPDGAPYVLDKGTKTVYRIDLGTKKASAVMKSGQRVSGRRLADPRFLTVAGRDLLMLDAKNNLWRWRPANSSGTGTVIWVRLKDSAELGDDVLAIATFVVNEGAGLYKLYVADPSREQVLVYAAAADGGGFPADPTGRLAAARPIAGLTDLFIDGDIFTVEDGKVLRVSPASGWDATDPPDTTLRAAPHYRVIASGTEKGAGVLYAYDDANARIVALDKSKGKKNYIEQYRLAGDDPGWKDLRDLVALPPIDLSQPGTIWWIGADGLNQSILTAVSDAASTPSTSPSGSPSRSPSASPSAAAKPTKKP